MPQNNAGVTIEEEAALRVHFIRPLLNLALRQPPTAEDWQAAWWHPADPHGVPSRDDTVIVQDGPRYAQVLTDPNDTGQVLVAWISRHSLEQAAKSLTAEMVHPDFAEIVGADARHRVLGEWVLGERLAALTDAERADRTFLHSTFAGEIRSAADPAAVVRRLLVDHRDNVARYGTRDNHARIARDKAYGPALVVQKLVQAFPRHPEAALAVVQKRMYPTGAVRVVTTP
jgi:hypothetical protein